MRKLRTTARAYRYQGVLLALEQSKSPSKRVADIRHPKIDLLSSDPVFGHIPYFGDRMVLF